MSGFQFNFCIDDNACSPSSPSPPPSEVTKDEDEPILWYSAEEVIPEKAIIDGIFELVTKAAIFIHGDLDIGYVYPEKALQIIKDNSRDSDVDLNSVLSAEGKHSDLLKGVYEGGLKIWECTHDLSEYLLKLNIDWKNTKVLDLGCGSGLLGMIALLSGAVVHFQDYNREVIEAMTIPSILLNLHPRKTILEKCKFFSGEWGSLVPLLNCESEDRKYDYILSSETIYNEECQEKLYEVIEKTLKKTGTAFVAAKTYYFGVGGGIHQFETLVRNKSKMDCRNCWKSETGVTREIIELKHLA